MRYIHILFSAILSVCTSACSNNGESAQTSATDDNPPLEHTDNERHFDIVLVISDNNALACYNHFDRQDVDPLRLDITAPDFSDTLNNWLNALTPAQLNSLKENSNVKIRVNIEGHDDLIKKVVDALQNIGITKYALTNC